jgi:DnaJ-class molecular chaperone
MQVCTKCDGDGSRTVELSNGEKIKKDCYVCSGQGYLPGTPAVAVMVPPQLKQKPVEIPKESKQPPVTAQGSRMGIMSIPMGDLSWLGAKRLTHG